MKVRELVFATGNKHKVDEIKLISPPGLSFKSLKDLDITESIPETQDSLKGNALQKATFVHKIIQRDCFSEDSGLEIDALDGAPGVITASYGGPERSALKNMQKVLDQLEDKSNRTAQFRACIALILNNEVYHFEGIIRGEISKEIMGEGGFGYDPIFIPAGYTKTFAELGNSIKNELSHRARAFYKMIQFLDEV